jgi:SprT protein
MALRKHELNTLIHFLPENTLEDVLFYLHTYKIHLIIRRDRKRILGDYRPAYQGKPHTISLNASLHPFHFLITFIHEVAHLLTFLAHANRVAPHGKEWKTSFAFLLQRFIEKKVFPEDIQAALTRSIDNLAASTCSDPHLFKVLKKYENNPDSILVENIGIGNVFITEEGKVFRILSKRRTRYECVELVSGKKFLFPALYEVRIQQGLVK